MEKLNTRLMTAQDVKEVLGVSESKAYKIIQQLNREMKKKGYYTIYLFNATDPFEFCYSLKSLYSYCI